jgi:hypothetical protein
MEVSLKCAGWQETDVFFDMYKKLLLSAGDLFTNSFGEH